MKSFSDTLSSTDISTAWLLQIELIDALGIRLGENFINFSLFQFYILFDVRKNENIGWSMKRITTLTLLTQINKLRLVISICFYLLDTSNIFLYLEIWRGMCVHTIAHAFCVKEHQVLLAFKHSDYSFRYYHNEQAWVTAAQYCQVWPPDQVPEFTKSLEHDCSNWTEQYRAGLYDSKVLCEAKVLRGTKMLSGTSNLTIHTLLPPFSWFQSSSFSTGHGEHSHRPVSYIISLTFSSLYRLSCSSRRWTSASSALRSSA